MKKLLTGLLAVVLCVITAFSLVGCAPEFTGFSNDTSKVVSNSGVAVEYDGYLYFVNGTKKASETANKGNIIQGAIYKVKLNDDGTISYKDEDKKEFTEITKVVNALVGFDEGSIHIFGNYLYYATTSNRENNEAEVLFGQIEFARIDLKSGAQETFYKTQTSDDTISYAYYKNGENIDFVIFEENSKLLTSFSISDTISTNFKKENIQSALLGENFGISKKGASVDDADCYIYYTLQSDAEGEYPDGNIVKFASSDGTFDETLNEKNEVIKLLTISAGKLIYAIDDYIYADTITKDTTGLNYSTDNLENLKNILSYKNYVDDSKLDVMFVEGANGEIRLLVYHGEQIKFVTWVNEYEYVEEIICDDLKGSGASVKFIGLYGNDLVLTVNKKVNKIQVLGEKTGEIVLVELSSSTFDDAKELMTSKIIGDYVYGFVTESSKTYMYRVSLADPEGSKTEKAEFVGVKE